ncbi:MAG: TlpA family protein disulfide reductase [Armatimonadetes bacterium]|nr:TlpA family protein disulfide reductase [Armatimonadota bacterium]
MGATICIAALVLAGQTPKSQSLDARIEALSNDLLQSLTLFDSLRAKVESEKDARKLVSQFNEKLESIIGTANKYLTQAKTDDEKVRIRVVRFEALASETPPIQKLVDDATDIAAKFKESPALCPAIENLTFYQYLTAANYAAFDTSLKQSKNEEVAASAGLASIFVQFMNDSGDINKFRSLGQQYPKTKAGQRATKVFDYRTKIVLGQPMIDLKLDLLGGSTVSLSSLKGKVVVLNFWGFWSPGCLGEMQEIKDYLAKYPTRLAWIGINTDNWTPAFVTKRIKEMGLTWENVAAGSPTGELPMDFGIVNYPSKIIIDAQGVVQYVPSTRDWRGPLEEALGKASG